MKQGIFLEINFFIKHFTLISHHSQRIDCCVVLFDQNLNQSCVSFLSSKMETESNEEITVKILFNSKKAERKLLGV